MTLNELRDACHNTAVSKGWWPADRDFGEMMMLVVTEIAEAMEESRRPGFDPKLVWMDNSFAAHPFDPRILPYLPGNGRKPEGFGIELADAFIRVVDTAGRQKVDLHNIRCRVCQEPHFCETMDHLMLNAIWHSQSGEASTPSTIGASLLQITSRVCLSYEMELAAKLVAVEPLSTRLAQILLSIATVAARYGVDLNDAIHIKMQYNSGRPFRHGNKLA